MELLPSDSRPMISLGYYLLRSAEYNEAVFFLEKGLDLKPHYAEADARMMLAEAYEHSGKIKEAKAQWEQVRDMQTTYPSYDVPKEEAKKKLLEHGS